MEVRFVAAYTAAVKKTISGVEAEDRPLSDEERVLLAWLIEHGTPEASEFATQLSSARVVGRCRCGCPTIDLGINGAKERTVGGSQVLADFMGETPDGLLVGVALHAREGKLSELEVWNPSGHDGVLSLPDISTLKPI
jgi:hypothetical protein